MILFWIYFKFQSQKDEAPARNVVTRATMLALRRHLPGTLPPPPMVGFKMADEAMAPQLFAHKQAKPKQRGGPKKEKPSQDEDGDKSAKKDEARDREAAEREARAALAERRMHPESL